MTPAWRYVPLVAAAPAPALVYNLPPAEHALLRQAALQWALSTATGGEASASIVARAEAYAAFVLMPLRDDQVALHERATKKLH